MTNCYDYTKQMMEMSAEKSSYTVYELTNTGLVFNSVFQSLEDAKKFSKKFTDETSTLYIYKTSCIKIYDAYESSEVAAPVVVENSEMDGYEYAYLHEESNENPESLIPYEESDDDYDPSKDLSVMTFCKYLKGYLLMPSEDSEYWGEKYFNDGWWIASKEGWFFKAEYYDWLIDGGASFVDVSTVQVETNALLDNVSSDELDVDWSSMLLKKYKKGYLLLPPKESVWWGEKYFMGGWWMPSKNGWFFKKMYYDELTEKMRISVDNTSDDVEDLSHMVLVNYGKGLLLSPSQDGVGDERFDNKQKYFLDGFWNNKMNAWFFKMEHKDKLMGLGASFVSDQTESDYEYVYGNEHKNVYSRPPTFVKYGRGWILKEDDVFVFDGSNYYLEDTYGWWVSTQKGWFFKDNQKEQFLEKYF